MAGKSHTKSLLKIGAISVAALTLAGCGADGPLASLNLGIGQQDEAAPETETTAGATTRTVERDVEAPEVFEVSDKALWDGRPSLGGVWVAHPDNKEPERVIIRNEANGKFVIGALFRRERDLPGPSLQLSSDAAQALGVQAGSPTALRVTALRKEEVPVASEAPTPNPAAGEEVASAPLSPSETEKLAAAAMAGIKATDAAATPAAAAKPAATAVATAPRLKSKVEKPYVQIGFFSIESNAKANVASMKANGIPAKMVSSTTNGKTFWRVIAGPASTAQDQRQLLQMVKEKGFADAYFVKG